MSDYISREAAKEAIVKAVSKGHSPFNAIVMLPAADVREVKRGKWSSDNIIFTDADGVSRSGMRGYKCSECDGFCIGESNFCPNCGADMREKSWTQIVCKCGGKRFIARGDVVVCDRCGADMRGEQT